MQPHESNPSQKGSHSPSEGAPGMSDLAGLTIPHGAPLAKRIAELLQAATPASLAEARDIMFEADSRPLLTFFGEHLGRCLTPSHIGLALDLLRRKSLPCTEGFLWALVTREHWAVLHDQAPALGSPEMSQLRRELAKLCLNPGLYFSERTRTSRPREVERLAVYPLVILRRCVSCEEASILARDATRGGIDPQMNSRALEALGHVEDRDPTYRVVPGRLVAALVSTMSDLLRDPHNRTDVYAFVERWLRKSARNEATEATLIRAAVHGLWDEFRSGGAVWVDGRGLLGTEVVALVRHFDDPVSKGIIDEASRSPDRGVATVALLCGAGEVTDALHQLMHATIPSRPLPERLSVLAAYGYSISDDIDAQILPIFRYTVARAFEGTGPGDDMAARGAGRAALISAFTRRLLTQPLQSPFTSEVFNEAMRLSVGGSSFLASTLASIARSGRFMPLSFYDDPALLAPIGVTIEILRHDSDRKHVATAELADEIERHFLVDGPARFGFEIGRREE